MGWNEPSLASPRVRTVRLPSPPPLSIRLHIHLASNEQQTALSTNQTSEEGPSPLPPQLSAPVLPTRGRIARGVADAMGLDFSCLLVVDVSQHSAIIDLSPSPCADADADPASRSPPLPPLPSPPPTPTAAAARLALLLHRGSIRLDAQLYIIPPLHQLSQQPDGTIRVQPMQPRKPLFSPGGLTATFLLLLGVAIFWVGRTLAPSSHRDAEAEADEKLPLTSPPSTPFRPPSSERGGEHPVRRLAPNSRVEACLRQLDSTVAPRAAEMMVRAGIYPPTEGGEEGGRGWPRAKRDWGERGDAATGRAAPSEGVRALLSRQCKLDEA